MMKNIITYALCFLLPVTFLMPVNGQKMKFGISAETNVNFKHLHSKYSIDNSDMRPGPGIDVSCIGKYHLYTKWNIIADLGYAGLSNIDKTYTVYTDFNGNPLNASKYRLIISQYILLTALATYQVSGNFHIGTGFGTNYLISSVSHYGTSYQILANERAKKFYENRYYRPFTFSIPVWIEYSILNFSLVLKLNQGINNSLEGKTIIKEVNNTRSFGIVYYFKSKKR